MSTKDRATSYITARNNLIYHCHTAGVSIGGYAPERGRTDHCTVVNNTLYDNDTSGTGSGEFQMQWNMADNIFANNIVYAGTPLPYRGEQIAGRQKPAARHYRSQPLLLCLRSEGEHLDRSLLPR